LDKTTLEVLNEILEDQLLMYILFDREDPFNLFTKAISVCNLADLAFIYFQHPLPQMLYLRDYLIVQS